MYLFLLISALIGCFDLYSAETTPSINTPVEIKAESFAEQSLKENSWAIYGTTGILPSEVLTGTPPRVYTLVPIQISGLWTIDDVGNDDIAWGWFRGNTSLRVTPYYHVVTHGPESRFVGLIGGPQYNFIQKGWQTVPFIGTQVGIGFTDSGRAGHLPNQQGQDFCFTFSVNVGARYFLSSNWSIVGELVYQHFSNGGLSEPARQNNGLDLLGPEVSLAYTF